MECRVPVSERALSQRVSRALAKKGQKLMKARGGVAKEQLGAWYVVENDQVCRTNVRLEPIARELEVLRGWEFLSGA
jgi:hypothetical protein